ncbi:MAG: DsrE family protein [Gammaproteobacteria bacterium]|nr:DsrE family protein [Gammaproteobacteria bacterium]
MKMLLLLLFCLNSVGVMAEAKYEETPYQEPKVVFDFFLDDPKKMASALYWLRSLMNPLMDSPYDYAPEFMELKVVIHGTEIVTLAEKNYSTYKDVVERMRYYASLGVQFRICGLAAQDYGYVHKDFYDFVIVVPSAITELAHWQQQGYGLITPQILDKKYSIEEIR